VTTRIALRIAYDGTGTLGWQTQSSGAAIQDHVQRAIGHIAQESISVVCAGRTDAGVHASHQVVHFDTDAQRPLSSWMRGVNSHLPSHIRVLQAQPASADFHARFSAVRRRYVYRLYQGHAPNPLLDRYATFYHHALDLSAMQQASQSLLGEHDFSTFRSSQCQAKSPVRHLQALHWHTQAELIELTLVANGFLHHMVRNIVGALTWIGAGRRPISWLPQILENKDRRLAAQTAPPQGLCLNGVDYGGAVKMATW
jgi:tRNA pseudouridine38-40 synthase